MDSLKPVSGEVKRDRDINNPQMKRILAKNVRALFLDIGSRRLSRG